MLFGDMMPHCDKYFSSCMVHLIGHGGSSTTSLSHLILTLTLLRIRCDTFQSTLRIQPLYPAAITLPFWPPSLFQVSPLCSKPVIPTPSILHWSRCNTFATMPQRRRACMLQDQLLDQTLLFSPEKLLPTTSARPISPWSSSAV